MPINFDEYNPETLEQAVAIIVVNLDESEREHLREHGDEGLHFGLGMKMRNAWLWEPRRALPEHFKTRFGLGHADDMSGLILDGVVASVRGEVFDPAPVVQGFKDHWAESGIDPLTLEEVPKTPAPYAPPTSRGYLASLLSFLRAK